MVDKGLLPSKFPINDKTFDHRTVARQIDSFLTALGGRLSGRALTKGAVGLPSTSLPVTMVKMQQASYSATLSNHFTVFQIEERNGESVAEPLDAQLFSFSNLTTQPISFSHRNALELSILRDIPHKLGREPLGFLSLGSWYCQIGANVGGEITDTNYAGLHVFDPPSGQQPMSAAAGTAIAGATVTGQRSDSRTFNLGLSFPVQRVAATGLLLSSQAFRDFQGRILLF